MLRQKKHPSSRAIRKDDEKSSSFTTFNNTNYHGVVAPRWRGKLRYAETLASPGTVFQYAYNLNSIYDPNRTGTGHQPYGRDQLATLYGAYRVHSATVTVAGTAGTSNYLALLANDDTAVIGAIKDAVEGPGSIWTVGNASTPCVLTATYKNATIAGMSHVEYVGSDGTAASFGADPSAVSILHVCFSDGTGTALGASTGQYMVVIDYDVECFNPILLGAS